MTRVLYIVPDIDGGGVGSIVLNYISHMNLDGMQIDVVTQDFGREQFYAKKYVKAGAKVFFIKRRKDDITNHFFEIKEIIKNGNYDVVHSHDQNWSVFYLLLAKKYGVRVRIAHSHLTKQDSDKWKIRILNCFNPLLKRTATGYFACGKEAGRYMWGKKIADSEMLYVMRNSVNVEQFLFADDTRKKHRELLGVTKKTVIGHIGRFEQQKNHKYLIKVFNVYKEINNNAVLLLIGKGQLEEEVKSMIEKLGIMDSVLFLGVRDDIPEILCAMDCFVLPSYFEGLPVVGIEAQASGLPCVFSDAVTDEVKLLDSTIFLSLNDDIDKWCKAIDTVIGKCNNREKAGQIIKDNGFSIDKEAEKLRNYYIVNARESERIKK